MNLSQRINNLAPYLFVEINKKIAEKRAKGEEVISFGIGDPDHPTPNNILNKLHETSKDSANHRYPETEGLLSLRQAIADWYQNRFKVTLDTKSEVLPLIGSKEGIGHMSFCLIDQKDVALVPDPAYPVYSVSTQLAGGEVYYLPLKENNSFLPELDTIPQDILKRAKVLWLNYPNNPTGAVADISFFDKVIEFAKQNNIVVCHDNPYSEVTYDGYKPCSFLEAKGAREVGIEFHSLSKSYNMTGWRIGMAVGNSTLIDALKRFKSNIDSGIPQAIQYAAIEALSGPQNCIAEHNAIYQRRRDLIVDVLTDMGCVVSKPKASLYVWAKVPPKYTSLEFSSDLLEQVGVLVIPGTGYGPSGEGFVRLSVTISDAMLVKALSKLSSWKNTREPFKPKR